MFIYRISVFLLILVLYPCWQAEAQKQKPVRDSLRTASDSLGTRQDSLNFRAIEEYSQKSKFTRTIHRMFFKTVVPETNHKGQKKNIKRPKSYRNTEGKIIRNINITTLDPFGYNLQDTSGHPQVFWMKVVNNLHIKTRQVIIKNLLLIKKGDPYDSLRVNESIRLIRSQKYVNDVFFHSSSVSGKNDSVDIFIRVSDVWSIAPGFGISKTSADIRFTDVNLAGLGNRFQGDFKRNFPTNNNVTRISYLIPNIRSSHVSLNLQHLFPGKVDMVKEFEFTRAYYSTVSSNLLYLLSDNISILKSIDLERTFYSPVVNWAGGIFLGQMITPQSYIQQDTIRYLAALTNIQDYWLAKAWHLYNIKYTDGRITSLVLSGRFVRTRYPDRTPEAEAANIFNNENIYFAGIGITSRKYIQDKFIFNYGKTEDVPVGRTFGVTTGFDNQETKRYYLGLNASWGNYYPFGYLSTFLAYGTYIASTGLQQEAISVRINYFTRLLNLGDWKIRQFIRPSLIIGINRLPQDNLTFQEGMNGFEGLKTLASRMFVLTLQTQSYPRWSLLGFHFGPYIFSSLGMLGDQSYGFTRSRIYSIFGLGLLIKNNYLTFNTFQISMTFYPFIPGNGNNIFRSNVYQTSDFGFMDFEISKPRIVEYR